MRWVAAMAWAAVAAWQFSRFRSDEFATINDLGPTAICLTPAVLIAIGGRIGRTAALVSAILAALVAVILVPFILGGCFGCGQYPWLLSVGAAALAVTSYLAAWQENRTVP